MSEDEFNEATPADILSGLPLSFLEVADCDNGHYAVSFDDMCEAMENLLKSCGKDYTVTVGKAKGVWGRKFIISPREE